MTRLMLDTNLLSTAYLPNPPKWLWDWLGSLPAGAIAIPWITIYETEYGIRSVQRYNPSQAIKLLAWFTEFLDSRLTFPEMDVKAARLLGQMAATPAMKHFFVTEDRKDKNGDPLKVDRIRLGGDPMLSALAISHQIPIATLNINDFLFIDKLFPLPGLYSPKANHWFIDPPIGWEFSRNANDDHDDTTNDWIKSGPRPR